MANFTLLSLVMDTEMVISCLLSNTSNPTDCMMDRYSDLFLHSLSVICCDIYVCTKWILSVLPKFICSFSPSKIMLSWEASAIRWVPRFRISSYFQSPSA